MLEAASTLFFITKTMDKKTIQEIKGKLEKERADVADRLKEFATEDPKLKGDWDTRFPKHNGGIGSESLEDAADEVETYATNLPIEYNLETRLKDIDLALGKIKNGTFGKCEKCGKSIEEKRLEIYTAARLCLKCQK